MKFRFPNSLAILFFSICSLEFGVAQTPEKPEKQPPPTTSVQIVNATSVEEVSLSVNGRPNYPSFPQGLFTSDAPVPYLTVNYLVTDKATQLASESEKIQYQPNANQSLVIMGDFTTDSPPDNLPQVNPPPPPPDPKKPYPPNVLFRVYSHAMEKGDQAIRIRVINAMPRKLLRFGADELQAIAPGGILTLQGQPAVITYQAEVDGKTIPILMKQDGGTRNAMIIFYLKNGQPSIVRAFENVGRPE